MQTTQEKVLQKVRNLVGSFIGRVDENTSYETVYQNIINARQKAISLSRSQINIFPKDALHILRIEGKTQINVFVGIINGEQKYIVVE